MPDNMDNAITISLDDTHSLDYSRLLQEGIAISQRLSGDSWTDYNIHDPGVTILEHVCFALSDMHYRTSFEIETYLDGSGEDCHYNEVNLYDTATITARHPSSPNDLRSTLIGRVSELEDVIVDMRRHEHPAISLVTLFISIRPGANNQVPPEKMATTVEQVRKVYSANRNLNQQLSKISVCKNRFYYLHGEIEVENNYLASQVLAEIYFKCCSDITDGGFSPADQTIDVPVSAVYRVVRNILGVAKIHSLWVSDDTGKHVDKMTQRGLSENIRIFFPQALKDINISLTYQGRAVPVNYGAFSLNYHEKLAKYEAARRAHFKVKVRPKRFNVPARKLSEYSSVQEWFPANYRIGSRSFPPESEQSSRAWALQLKAYLLLFENALIDKLDALNEIKYLFAPLKYDWFAKAPMHTEALRAIPKIGELIDTEDLELFSARDGKSYLEIHHAIRILDYLIALYGEEVSNRTYYDFNVYFSSQEARLRQYSLRKRFLAHIVEITRNRNKACDLSSDTWNKHNISGLQLKLSLLLDFEHIGIRSLSFGVLRNGIQIAFDDNLDSESLLEPFAEFCFDGGFIEGHFQPVELPTAFTTSKDELMTYFGDKFVCKQSAVTPDFITHVVNPECLLVGHFPPEMYPPSFEAPDDRPVHLVFWSEKDQHYYLLNSFEDLATAIRAGQVLRQFFIQVSLESEGVHVIENDLLASDMQDTDFELLEQLKLFGDQITLVLPNWTARTSDKGFQAFVEEVVVRNIPAHLYARLLWLDMKSMYLFEQQYKAWLSMTANPAVSSERKSRQAQSLALLLNELIAMQEG